MIRVSEISAIKNELDASSAQNIVLYGPQCAGKTTLAHELSGFEYISLGQIVRSCNDDNPLKQQIDRLVDQAKPLPPELGLQFIAPDIKEKLSDGKRVLVDGYPRKANEYTMMTEWLAAEGLPAIDMFLEVTARRSVLLARYNVRTKRNVENRDFFELRYHQYMDFSRYVGSLAVEQVIYDTSGIS